MEELSGVTAVLMHEEALTIDQVRQLRGAYSEAIWENRTEDSRVFQAHSAFDHFADAILAGCARDENLDTPAALNSWIWDAAIGLHFGERQESIVAREDAKRICERVADNPALREAYHWASVDLDQAFFTERGAWGRYVGADSEHTLGPITEANFP